MTDEVTDDVTDAHAHLSIRAPRTAHRASRGGYEMTDEVTGAR